MKDSPQPLRLFYNLNTGILAITTHSQLQGRGNIDLGIIRGNYSRFLAFNWLLGEYIQQWGHTAEAHQISTLYNRFVIEYKAGNFPAYAGWLIGAITQKPYMHEIPAITSDYHTMQPITKLFTKHFPRP